MRILILLMCYCSWCAHAQKVCDKNYDYPTPPMTVNTTSIKSLNYRTHFGKAFYKSVPNQLILESSRNNIEIKTKGGSICQCEKNLHFQLTPSSPLVFIYFADKETGDTITSDTFKVRLTPTHDVKLTFNGNEYSQKKAVWGFDHWKEAELTVVWPQRFRSSFPSDFFKYQVTNFDFLLIRGKRPLDHIKGKQRVVDIKEMMKKSRNGDRLIISAYMYRIDSNGNSSYLNCGVFYNYHLGE